MRTTLDLPENLIKEAMNLTHAKTKTALIIRAIEDLVRKQKIEGLKDFKGKVDLDIVLIKMTTLAVPETCQNRLGSLRKRILGFKNIDKLRHRSKH